ncbi:MAG: hypothetical protein HXY50_02600 [Ignavibacteriaceae bacterium]|nr:hypothetical protein [Ignavibacteriaceae bacterium]
MSKAAKSVLVFGIYLVLNGIGFLLMPNTMFGLLGLPPTNEPWIQVVGMLLLFLAYYYIMSARNELTILFRWSVYARATVIIFFSAFVVLGIAPAILIMFGVIDLLGAIWTALALKTK